MKEIEENKSYYRNYMGQKMGETSTYNSEINFYLDTALDDVERIEKN